jgi:hypothetical protein
MQRYQLTRTGKVFGDRYKALLTISSKHNSDNDSDLVEIPEELYNERLIDNRAYQVHSLGHDIYCAPIDQVGYTV